jgi:PAS domain-containing protein
MQPLQPQAQDKTEGRAFDYPVGWNLRIEPRSGEGVSFYNLRSFADGYDFLRLIIETRKDQVEAYEWDVLPAEDADGNVIDTPETDAHVQQVRDFFQHPSHEHDWQTWLRAILEEVFVIDALCIYPRYTKGGDLFSLDLVDGATIKRLLDDTGRTPLPPDPAYQQVLKGIPTADYSADQLIYRMRNPRVSRIYGYSPVEQIIMTVNIALRKQLFQLQYYTEGNIPEALMGVPEGWSVEQIKQFQTWFDEMLAGKTDAKRKLWFVPMDPTKMKETKTVDLKDLYDEWLARIVCFAFSIPPTPFVHQMNRAVAETLRAEAKQEGLLPVLTWLKRVFNYIIVRHMNITDVQFQWKLQGTVDAVEQAKIDMFYIQAHVKTPDEVRGSLGLDPLTPEQKDTAWPAPPLMFDEPGVDEPKPKPGDEQIKLLKQEAA